MPQLLAAAAAPGRFGVKTIQVMPVELVKNDLEIWDIISKLRSFEFLSSYRILKMVWSLRRERLVATINATPVSDHGTHMTLGFQTN